MRRMMTPRPYFVSGPSLAGAPLSISGKSEGQRHGLHMAMALSKRIDIAHRQFHIAHCFAGKFLPNPFPCDSIGNAQCAMANEIQRYSPNLMPSAFQSQWR